MLTAEELVTGSPYSSVSPFTQLLPPLVIDPFSISERKVSECKSCPDELSVSYNGSLKKADSKDDIVRPSFQNCRVHKFQKE